MEGCVEVVNECRGVVVVMRSEFEIECGKMLNMVVRKISHVLKEFCCSLVTTEYLLNPKELHTLCFFPEVDSLQLY